MNTPKPKINSHITAQELRVIDETGKNLGVLKRDEALALARPGENLDLIEIAPNAKPPVARIMNYDKFRYEEEKRMKRERMAQKGNETKHVQISARAAQNDLAVRVRQVEKFFAQGHAVEVTIRLRGREKRNKEWAMQKLREFLAMIPTEHKVLREPRFGGRGAMMQIAKK